jgi:hypothetical protein
MIKKDEFARYSAQEASHMVAAEVIIIVFLPFQDFYQGI